MNITVTRRGAQTKGERRQRLRQGRVPGAVYGKTIEPFLVEVPAKAVADVLLSEAGLNTVIDLTVEGEGKTHTVLIDNLERDRITRGFLNVGFHEVSRGEKVTAQIPIQLVGERPDAADPDLLLEQALETITVHAQPADLPPHLDVDVSQMKVGDVLRVSDLPHNRKLEFSTPDDTPIASLHYSRTAQIAEEDTAVAAGAPSGLDAVTELRADRDQDSDSVTGAQGQP